MRTQIQQDKTNDTTKSAAEHQKASIQKPGHSLNENAPAFTKIESVTCKPALPQITPAMPKADLSPKPVPALTAQEAVHEVMPIVETKKLDVKEIAETPIEKPVVKDPIKKDTAAHGDDDRMSKKARS